MAHRRRRPQKPKHPVKLIDRLIYVAVFVEPMFTVPQIYQIFHERSARNVSILAWAGFELMTSLWIWYVLAHRDKSIVIYQGLFFIVDGAVLVGAIIYGAPL